MFVRWLGAYGPCEDVVNSAVWETTQTAREVAAEPLYRGRSLLLAEIEAVNVGLVLCQYESVFRAGFFRDCWSSADAHGNLTNSRAKAVRDMHRFCAAWAKMRPARHGEVFFDRLSVKAVALRKGACAKTARKLSARLGVPIILIEEHRV